MQIAARVGPSPLVAALVAALGCGPPAPPRPTPEETRAALEQPAGKKGEPASPRPRLVVYVDSSMSMQGYVAPGRSQFLDVFSSMFNELLAAGYQPAVYSYSRSSRTAKAAKPAKPNRTRPAQPEAPASAIAANLRSVDSARVLSEIARRAFYDGTESPLSQLLVSLAGEPEGANRLSILVSDLVHSERLTDDSTLIAAFDKLSRAGRELELLAFCSAFDGDYYPTVAGSKFRVVLADPPNACRPFYLLIVAPSSAALDQLGRYLKQVPPRERFRPGLPPLTITAMEPAKAQDPAPRWQKSGPNDTTNPGGSWSLFERRAPRDGEPPLLARLTLRSAEELKQFEDLGRLRFTTRTAARPAGGKWTKPIDADWRPTAIQRPEGLFLQLPVPRPQPRSWEASWIRAGAGAGNLRPPGWVAAWSTPRDDQPAQAAKTYHLDLLVSAMLRAVTESQVTILDQTLLLGRGE